MLTLEHSPADAETPLDRLLQSEARAELAALLAELPDVEADALRLRFFAGLPFEEIARAMDSSLNGAKVRVRRGLTRLAERLRQRELLSHGRTSSRDTPADFPPSRRSLP
jgi:RNA polymerase sigma-70 factor (ECF subfamily)